MEFPTFFRLRVVGYNNDDFAGFLVDHLLPAIPGLSRDHLHIHPSAAGKYVAVHVEFMAESREQLDGIYGLLNGHKRVLWVM